MAFLVGGKIEFLCLFAIQDGVTGEKNSNLRGDYSRHRRLPKYGILASFVLFKQLQDSLNSYRTLKKCLKLKFLLVSRNILIFTWLKFQEILKTLESQVWWIWVILTENDS